MPEGDTIYRSAARMHAALAGQILTGITVHNAQVLRLLPKRLLGQEIESVRSHGKHLLHWFAPAGMALHTHMRMTGSWHLYAPGERWRKGPHLARVILRTETVEAVAFAVPVIELLTRQQVAQHRSLSQLGPDPLADGPATAVDLVEARRRLDTRAETEIGVAILDQRVLAGVGNVYKNEVLFIHQVNPWTRVAAVPPDVRDKLLATSAGLLQANIAHGASSRITTRPPGQVARMGSRARDAVWIYGKAGRPCPRCGASIRCQPQGDHARLTYWCPTCQNG